MGTIVSRKSVHMFTARQKIKKEKGEPTELENQVAQAFVDLEINNEELRPFLKNLHIAGAKEVVVNKTTAAIVIFIPYRLKDLFRKNQVRLVRELEKKFSASMWCSWPSARSRTRSLASPARLPTARSVPTLAPSPPCTMPSSRTLCTPPTSVASVFACPSTVTSSSRCPSTTPMRFPTSSRPSLLCMLPSPASTPLSSSPRRRNRRHKTAYSVQTTK